MYPTNLIFLSNLYPTTPTQEDPYKTMLYHPQLCLLHIKQHMTIMGLSRLSPGTARHIGRLLTAYCTPFAATPEDMPQLLLSLHFLEPKQEIFYYFQLGISRRLSRYDTIRTYLGRYKYEHQCRNAYFNA